MAKPFFHIRMLVLSLLFGSIFFFSVHRLVHHSHGIFEYVASYFTYPVFYLHSMFIDPIKIYFYQRKSFKELEQQMNELQAAYQNILAENIALKAIKNYTDSVQEVCNFKERYASSDALIAQVLERRLSDHEQIFLVDVGAQQGIKRDMVAVFKNCLVGRIDEVYPWYSKIRLITDSSCKVASYCAKTGANGIHQGFNTSKKTMLSFVSHLNTVEQDDIILSSGEGLVFPQGFALGSIISVKPDGLYKKISVAPLIDFHSLKYCMIIAKGALGKKRF